jgi:hypothetical protein
VPYNGYASEPEYIREWMDEAELEFYRAQAVEMEKNFLARRNVVANRMQFSARQADVLAGQLANWGISPVVVGRALEQWERGDAVPEDGVLAVCFRVFAEYQTQETEGR